MIHQVKCVLFVAGLLMIPDIASAQNRMRPARPVPHPVQMGSTSFVRHPAAGRPIIVRMPAVPLMHRPSASGSQTVSTANGSIISNGTNSFVFSSTSPLDLGQLLNDNVPGLGFDFSHLAALNQNLGERAFIDPVTQQEIALSERLLQITPSINVIPSFGGFPEPIVEEQPQPQVIVLQQPVPAAEEPASAVPAAAPPAPVAEQAPLPDVGEFVLVTHNGTQIKAVAFTRQNDQIVYITKEGIRSSFPAADLDTTATKQLNQQHGTPLQL